MSLLKELFALSEAEVIGDNHVELADLIKNFPSQHKKAIEKLWGGPRLVWHNIPFFGSGDQDIYDLIRDAVKSYDNEDMIEVEFNDIDFGDDTISLRYSDPSNPEKVGQECYLGYDAQEDCLYVGYDTSLDEEIFNQDWDEEFKKATGEEFEYDEPEHREAFEKAWEQYKKMRPWVMFKLELESADNFSVTVEHSGLGGFYPEGHQRAKSMGLIDLRLD